MGKLDALIGTRLKLLRQSKGIPVAALASHLNVSELHIAALEQGRQHLEAGQLVQICSLFGCSVEDFMRDL